MVGRSSMSSVAKADARGRGELHVAFLSTLARGNLASLAVGNTALHRGADPGEREVVIVTTIQEWVAESIESTAHWRDTVAERYPEDLRNRHSAAALRELAATVRGISDEAQSLTQLRTLVSLLDEDVESLAAPEGLSRFGFDLSPKDVTDLDAHTVLNGFYKTTLQGWRYAERYAEIEVPAALAELIDAELGPAEADDDASELEGIHARIDRLEARVARLERTPPVPPRPPVPPVPPTPPAPPQPPVPPMPPQP